MARVRLAAGTLDQRVVIYRKTITYDAYNAPTPTWANIGTLRASVTTSGGGEFYAAQRLHIGTEAVIGTRYTNAINTGDRLRHDDILYDIIDVNDVDSQHVKLLLSCKAAT